MANSSVCMVEQLSESLHEAIVVYSMEWTTEPELPVSVATGPSVDIWNQLCSVFVIIEVAILLNDCCGQRIFFFFFIGIEVISILKGKLSHGDG